MSFHQFFYPEMVAHDTSCPVALPEHMSKYTYLDQAEVDDFIRSNHPKFRPRTFNSSLLYQPLVEVEEMIAGQIAQIRCCNAPLNTLKQTAILFAES